MRDDIRPDVDLLLIINSCVNVSPILGRFRAININVEKLSVITTKLLLVHHRLITISSQEAYHHFFKFKKILIKDDMFLVYLQYSIYWCVLHGNCGRYRNCHVKEYTTWTINGINYIAELSWINIILFHENLYFMISSILFIMLRYFQ